MIKTIELHLENNELNIQNEITVTGGDGCTSVIEAGGFLTTSGASAAHIALEGAAAGPEEWGFGMAVTGGLFLAGWGAELAGAVCSAAGN